LGIGRGDVRPDAAMGYKACESASMAKVAEGNVGAGSGASVGKLLGAKQAMKSGLGSASIQIDGGIVVGALVAVNAFGDIIDPQNGGIVAGLRSAEVGPFHIGAKGYFADTLELMRSMLGRNVLSFATKSNTVLAVVAVNADLTKAGANKMAQMAHDGLARTIRPAHTMLDGDTIFALATGGHKLDVTTAGTFAAEALSLAVLRAVRAAAPAGGLPGLNANGGDI
jgi:L-aminopeptidase/D-esterase-like protein